jgi:hypothetical protein
MSGLNDSPHAEPPSPAALVSDIGD